MPMASRYVLVIRVSYAAHMVTTALCTVVRTRSRGTGRLHAVWYVLVHLLESAHRTRLGRSRSLHPAQVLEPVGPTRAHLAGAA